MFLFLILPHLTTENLFSVSVSLFLFYSYVCDVFYIPHINNILRFLPLYLISLSMIVSSSIYVAANGIILFFVMAE